ncbi:MAG TPA: cellulase family glycosylhydrolase, partial [Ruminococcus flavefaciens]|nr:cellulase family glycosylhydrolase [Ruminococcus flavefaciens]
MTLSGASGGKALDMKDNGDSVSIECYSENEGMQTISIRYCQPYDEDGKYQTVIVNGQNVGDIFCAYTGEGKFSTATIKAPLIKGKNTVEIVASWGWTFLDSLTIGGQPVSASASSSASANPLISRGVPAYSGKSNSAGSANDDKYYTSWTSQEGDYIAYDLSSVPENQRKKVLAAWYNNGTYDNIGIYVNKADEPVDYTIEVNKAGGGSYPQSGWETAEEVKGNSLSSRQHLIDMDGYNWIRMNVKKASGGKVSLNLDIHSASDGISDSWVFFGDSITAGGMGNAYGTGFAEYVNRLDSRFYPAQQNGGIGGITSRDGKENIDKWLSGSPVKYVSIAYGTNDCWGNPNNTESYYNNTKYMIDAVLKAGKVPVLPKIPYSTNSDVGSNTGYYNAMIDKLYSEYGDKLVHGPDFDEYFRNNTWGLGPDGVHPNDKGYDGMRKLWAETMYKNVYSKIPEAEAPVTEVPETPGTTQPQQQSSQQTTASDGFHVEGQKIIDANGNNFIMRGVNVPHAWFQNNTEQTLRAVAAKGCNSVRVVCLDGASGYKTSADEIGKVIGWCKENKLICVLEVHDATGKDSISDIVTAAKYWTEMKDILNENRAYVIVNIANEWVGTWDSSTWSQGYQQAMKVIRDAGIKNMLMIDAAGWGQYGTSIKEKGAEVFASDPEKNTVFSIHFYGTAGKNASTIKSNID